MSKISSNKRFRSGSEILIQYVPSFQREPMSSEEQSNEIVERLLNEFDKALDSGLKKTKKEDENDKLS